jgi:hypothetical protein
VRRIPQLSRPFLFPFGMLSLLGLVSLFGFESAGAVGLHAEPVKSGPPKTAAKKAPVKKAPAKKAPAAPKRKIESDSSAGRDKFCGALLATRAQILKNVGLGTGSTTQEIIQSTSRLNQQTLWELADQAHLKVLRYAGLAAGASYEVTGTAIAELPKIENFKAELDATVQEFIKTVDYDAFGTLQSYAITRCNFSMFISDTDNLDAAPDTADIAKLLADVDAAAEADAKIQFPPLPPKSATWPRKDRYIGVAKSLGNNPVVQP